MTQPETAACPAQPAVAARTLVTRQAIHSAVYTDPGIFEAEMRHVFGKAWLLIGHESQAPEAGDHFVTTAAGRPVLVVRDRSGKLHAFYNACPHRGARLRAQAGVGWPSISCPYHGWTFQLDGAFLSLPAIDEYPEAFRAAPPFLRRLEAQESYRGFLFVRTTQAGPGLEEFLGPIRDVIDDLVERSPKHELQCKPAILRHRYRGNWKLTFENLNDTIHAGFAHAVAARIASDLVAETPEQGGDPLIGLMMANGKPISFFQGLRMILGRYGHSYFEAHMPTAYPDEVASALADAFTANGRTPPRGLAAGNDKHLGLLYPNAVWHARYQVVRMVYPIAPDETEVVTLSFGLVGAPESTYDSARSYCNGSSSAMSPVITDDLEIYEGIQANYRHLTGWHPITRGLDEDFSSDESARQVRATSEAFIRNQYRTWLAYLEAPDHA